MVFWSRLTELAGGRHSIVSVTVELHKAIRFRDHAEELRMIAEKSNSATRSMLLLVADEYDRLAATLEDVARRPGVSQSASSAGVRRQAG